MKLKFIKCAAKRPRKAIDQGSTRGCQQARSVPCGQHTACTVFSKSVLWNISYSTAHNVPYFRSFITLPVSLHTMKLFTALHLKRAWYTHTSQTASSYVFREISGGMDADYFYNSLQLMDVFQFPYVCFMDIRIEIVGLCTDLWLSVNFMFCFRRPEMKQKALMLPQRIISSRTVACYTHRVPVLIKEWSHRAPPQKFHPKQRSSSIQRSIKTVVKLHRNLCDIPYIEWHENDDQL
jgi:hypothetical protein